MTFTSIIHPDEVIIRSRQVTATTTWRDAGDPVISHTTTPLNIRDILPGGAPTERCVPDVGRHCAGQQCDILFHIPRRLHGHNIDNRGNISFVWQLTSTPAAFSVQRAILITVQCVGMLGYCGVGTGGAGEGGMEGRGGINIVKSYFGKQSHRERNEHFRRSLSLSELSRDQNLEPKQRNIKRTQVAPYK